MSAAQSVGLILAVGALAWVWATARMDAASTPLDASTGTPGPSSLSLLAAQAQKGLADQQDAPGLGKGLLTLGASGAAGIDAALKNAAKIGPTLGGIGLITAYTQVVGRVVRWLTERHNALEVFRGFENLFAASDGAVLYAMRTMTPPADPYLVSLYDPPLGLDELLAVTGAPGDLAADYWATRTLVVSKAPTDTDGASRVVQALVESAPSAIGELVTLIERARGWNASISADALPASDTPDPGLFVQGAGKPDQGDLL